MFATGGDDASSSKVGGQSAGVLVPPREFATQADIELFADEGYVLAGAVRVIDPLDQGPSKPPSSPSGE
jgi:hypothetical protein